MKILVKFNSDWADEFDVSGFKVYEPQEWRDEVRNFKATKGLCQWNFGSNEGFEIDDREEWLAKYETARITNLEASALQMMFGTHWSGSIQFGNFPELSQVSEGCDE